MIYRGTRRSSNNGMDHDGKEVKAIFHWTKAKYDAELSNAIDDNDLSKGVRNDCIYVVTEGTAGILKASWTAVQAVAADADGIMPSKVIAAAGETVLRANLIQPPCARNLTITGTGTAGDVAAGDVVFSGKNIHGEAITETITLTADSNTIKQGTKAFAEIDSVEFPAMDGAAAAFSIGFGDKLGLSWELSQAIPLVTLLGTTAEGTAPTFAVDADEVEKNTVDLDSALDGSTVQAYFLT